MAGITTIEATFPGISHGVRRAAGEQGDGILRDGRIDAIDPHCRARGQRVIGNDGSRMNF